MRTNPVKAKLLQGQIAWGTWISSGSYHVTRALLTIGFDWLTVDMEHSHIDWSDMARLVGAIADQGVAPFVRVPEGTPFYIKRALDAGAFGVIIPMVETAEAAANVARASRFPPEGERSAGGALHFLHFAGNLKEYLTRANQEIMVILQIESPRGIANCQAIAAVPGCDALFVGPLDLETRLRAQFPGRDISEPFTGQVEQLIAVGTRQGKVTGIHARTPAEAQFWAAKGMRFIAVGNDIGMLTERALEYLATLRNPACQT